MEKRLTKIIAMGVLLIVSLLLFTGCGSNKYNAVILTTGFSFKEEFLKDNLTRGSHYLNENGEIVSAEGESYPRHRVFIIKSHEDANLIFESFSDSIDFEKEMLIIYIFTTINPDPCKINKVFIDEDVLKINYKFQRSKIGSDNTSSPTQRCLLVKIDKHEVASVEFTNG